MKWLILFWYKYKGDGFLFNEYRTDPKFMDRQVWANSVDPDQTVGAVWSGSALFAIPSASFGLIILW